MSYDFFVNKNEKQKLNKYQKCGEVFHLNGCLKIFCTDCNEKLFDFQDFFDHFQNIHCRDRTKYLAEAKIVPPPPSPDFEGFEAVTLCSPNSQTESKIFSGDEEENVLEKEEILEKRIDDLKKIPLQLRKNQSCEKCSKEFVTKKGLHKHIRRMHFEPKEYKCNQCTETFQKQTDLWKHERVKHVTFQCTMCEKSYRHRKNLRNHLAMHSEVCNFKCDYEDCRKSYKNQRQLNDHKKTHNPSNNYVCEICGYRTVRKQTLHQHVRTHTGEKPYPCKICGKHFISQAMVKEHLATHATERIHVCDVCGASFTRPKALYHHKPLHLGIKKFVCTICDRAFAQAAGLSAHVRKHKIDGKLAPGIE